MRTHLVKILVLLVAVALLATACSAPPTPTPMPTPTLPPTPLPPPTAAPTATRIPPTPTTAATNTPANTPTTAPTATPAQPSPTSTRTLVPATRRPSFTATPPRPPAAKGSIAYHKNDRGIDRVLVLNLDTNGTTALVDVGPVMDIARGTNAHVGDFSPDNSKFAYIQVTSSGQPNNLRVLDLKTGTSRGLYSEAGISSPSWSPDGTRIAFIRMFGNERFWAISYINADGTGTVKDFRTNTQGEQYQGGISWSKQGIFAVTQNLAAPTDIYTMFSDGGGLTNRTNNPADDTTPAWSPDGRMLAFVSNRDGRQQIYVMNADGSGLRRVSQGNFNDVSPAWSPDGNWIAFSSTREGSTDLYMMDTRGGNLRRLTTGGGDNPMWSH